LIYKCVNCGGNVVYDPQSKHTKCLSCGGSDCEEVVTSETPVVCMNCGAQIPFTEFGSATRCPSCGTYVIKDSMVSYPYGPDVVIPFNLSKHDAEECLRKEFGKKLFLPSTFLSAKTLEKMRGIYVPFWMYDFNTDFDYSAVGTKVRTWTSGNRRYTETSYFDVYRKMHVDYRGVPVDASIEMPDNIMDLMEPYSYNELIAHDNKYLSGFESEAYNYTPDQLEERVEHKIDADSRAMARDEAKGYNSLTKERLNTNNRRVGNKFALLPVWVYEYRYNGKNYTFYVNGQTGKCVGTPPLSTGRAVGLTAILAGALFVGLNGLALLLGVI
jgi:DNA-directed RNA polymerase subunit RPC12/RpoP